MDDSHELLFFQGDLLTLKLQKFELFAVLTTQLSKLSFSVFEGGTLVLELLINRHDLLEVSCHPLLVDLKLSVLSVEVQVLLT